MISAQLQPVGGLQSVERTCRNARILLGRSRAPQQPVLGAVPITSRSSGSSSVSSRPSVSCSAEPEPVSGYTPADYISFSTDENKQCHHNAEVWVEAPLEVCYSLWSQWTKLLDFLDLVGQIGLDNANPNMALFQCFYRYRKLPLMEIVFLLEREEREETLLKSIVFNSVYGMPIKGEVQFAEQLNGMTRVRLYFTHPVPTLLTQLQIGPFGVETDMKQILQENLAAYKQQAEALAPADFEQQKAAVIAKVQSKIDELNKGWEEEERQQQEQQQQEADAEQQGEQQQQPEQTLQQQPQQPEQPPPPAAAQEQQGGTAPKRLRGRTAAKASAAADAGSAAGGAAGATVQPDAAATAAAAADASGQPPAARGRKTTRSRTASKAAAAGTGEGSSSTGKRRSRMSSSTAGPPADDGSSGNGTGPTPSGSGTSSKGRRTTTRRSSKRPSTAAQE